MDNNSNLSPVTESEVMNFASRICTTIVAHSQQQGRIESLERSLNDTTTERDHLRSENSRLNQEIGETTTLADGYSRERDDAFRRVADLEGKLRYQEEMAISRDAKVAELQGQLKQAQDEARTKSQEAESNFHKFNDVSGRLQTLTESVEYWRQAADSAHHDAIEAQTKLEKIPFAIRSHFTGEVEAKPEPQTPKSETAKDVPITEGNATEKPAPWTPPVEMKPVQEESKPDHPEWMTSNPSHF
jgi:chromosome segregation ATPase